MDLINLCDEYDLSNKITLRITHFAKGIYPCLDENRYSTYPVNRMFCILENPNGAQNFLGDRNKRHEYVPGTVYLAPAFHPVVFRLDSQVHFISIHFHLELFYGVDLFSATKEIYEKPMPEMIARLKRYFETPNKLLAALELKRSVYEMAMRLLESHGAKELDLSIRFAPYRNVLEYIASRCIATTRIEELAKVAGMSREAFSRSFAAQTGLSPKKFFDRQLAQRAAERLKQPRITAREVAYELQFSSEFVFSRFFKRQMGISPKAFQLRTKDF